MIDIDKRSLLYIETYYISGSPKCEATVIYRDLFGIQFGLKRAFSLAIES